MIRKRVSPKTQKNKLNKNLLDLEDLPPMYEELNRGIYKLPKVEQKIIEEERKNARNLSKQPPSSLSPPSTPKGKRERTKSPKKAPTERKTNPEVDYNKLTVVELKNELRKHGKVVYGRKAELIERLEGIKNKEGIKEGNQKLPKEGMVDYNKWTVVELKGELRKQGKLVSGRKAELIERLEGTATPPKGKGKGKGKGGGKGGKGKEKNKWEQMTVVQLKAELRKQGKSANGRKAELIARLQ